MITLLATTDTGTGTGAAILLLVILALYFVPTIIAARRKHPSVMAIAAVNILAGWFFGIGWLIALVWSLAAIPGPAVIVNQYHSTPEDKQ